MVLFNPMHSTTHKSSDTSWPPFDRFDYFRRSIFGLPAGGIADSGGRTIAKALAARLGQSVIVDNKADKPRPFNLAKNGDTASLYIYDVISADWGVSALSVIEAINQAGDVQTLNIHINSPGGDVFEGRAIMAAISAFRGKTVAHIDSLCASAATSIALACNEIRMSEGAFFMIHNASGMAWGDKTELRNTADVLEKIEGAVVNDYTSRTG